MYNHTHNNYISSFTTNTDTYHIYHNNIISFGSHELYELIFPGIFHELKTGTKYPEMFVGTISAPSRYELPDYIIPDKLTDSLRTTLAKALIFIHTWIEENPSTQVNELLVDKYATYSQFFDTMFHFISYTESDADIKDICADLKQSIRKINHYLGPYHGTLKYCVGKKQQVADALILIICLSQICVLSTGLTQ